MNSNDLVFILSQFPFVVIFGITLGHALRRPRRATIDIALLFGVFASIVVIGWTTDQIEAADQQFLETTQIALLAVLPYLLLRIVADFTSVPARLLRAAAVVCAFLDVSIVVNNSDLPAWLIITTATYFIGLGMYSAWAFTRGARHANGVTSRRLYAAAWGSVLIGLVILLIAMSALVSSFDSAGYDIALRALTLAAGLAYFVAFSPPKLLRRAWQEPELRALLAQVAVLPRLPTMDMIVRELEDGAAATIGAPHAAIGLWDADRQLLYFSREGLGDEVPSGVRIGGRVFAAQQAIFSENALRDDPANEAIYRAHGALAIMAAPITAGARALGVLTVYAPRPPIFADDDLQFVQLLADQAAIILESRSLIDEATLVQARAEATRLRDDFLVAAAHDLRTPLTAAIARAQFIQYRAQNGSESPAPIDPADVRMVVDDLRRLSALMNELLDAARAEHGQLLGNRHAVDLVELVQECQQRHDWSHHRYDLTAPRPVIAEVDPARMAQVIDNLLENAIKYSPDGGDVRVIVWTEDDCACLSVSDTGIGIPPADLPYIFDRFHRARNVETPSFAGMGLGLYICQSIIAQHDGTISANSVAGESTTFEVSVPLAVSR